MKKQFVFVLMAVMLCVGVISAQAAQMLNIYIDKDALLAHDVSSADIRVRPEGMVRVTRHSLWPWDEAGEKWSMFLEIENTSNEKIVVDEDWLIACRSNREEIEAAAYVFESTTNTIEPGESAVLYAGVNPYVKEKHRDADVHADEWDVEGLSDFARRIRQAEILRVRLNVRIGESSRHWPAIEIEPRVWIDGRTIHFEWTNESDDTADFRTIGAVISDREGRMIDVISRSHSTGAIVAPGETLRFQKALAAYVTQEQADAMEAAPFAYLIAQKP